MRRSSERGTMETHVNGPVPPSEPDDEANIGRPRFGQVSLRRFGSVTTMLVDRRRRQRRGRPGACGSAAARSPAGGANSQWQRAEETRLQCSEPGFLKDHSEDREEPDADQHREELYGVISKQPILVRNLLAHPASPSTPVVRGT
jgi:hypothetical protein